MKLRRRLSLLYGAALLGILALTGTAATALWSTGRFGQQIDAVQRRFEVAGELVGLAGTYKGQVVEVLLLGREQERELDTARIEMERALARLSVVTRAQFAALAPAQLDSELREIETTRRMVELFHAIDMSASRALQLHRNGQNDEAVSVFEREVEFRLANEFEPLLDDALTGERAEIAVSLAEITQYQLIFTIAAATIAILALALVGGLGIGTRRALLPRLQHLAQGIAAIGAGQFETRIPVTGSDEITELSETVNAMAIAIARQQDDQRQAGDQLSAEIGARTAQLRDANELLRNIDSRRAQFLADVSHELRTPLTILRGEADIALRVKGSADEQQQSLELIQSQAAELGKLLDELIAFARSDAEAQDYAMARLDIARVVTAAVQEGGVLADTREVRVTLGLEDRGSEIDGDFRRLKQALLIGLDNAVKHSPPGGRIEVSTQKIDGSVVIAIADEGPGVAPEDEAHVFERFYRAKSEVDLHNQGLGIGLGIARDIVERHGGTIVLVNRSERPGARLELTLPLIEATAP